jgi:hypothetical protein
MERERERCRHCRERCREHGAKRRADPSRQTHRADPGRHTDQPRPEQTRPDTQRESQRQLELNCSASRPFLGLHSLLGLSQLIDVLDILCTVSSSTTITSHHIPPLLPPVEIWKETRNGGAALQTQLFHSPTASRTLHRKTNQPVEPGAREYPCPR